MTPPTLFRSLTGALARTINVSSDSVQSEEFLELANGCLCCSIKDTGVAAIEKLMQRKGAFDHILLETTGLADPGPIAGIFWQNEEYSHGLGRDIFLDGVVCLVDAVYGQKQLEEDHTVDGLSESIRQIACSDVILLNKIDLVSEPQLSALEAIIYKINPVATIHRTSRSNVDLKYIMGIGAYATRVPSLPSNNHDKLKSTHYTLRGVSSILVPIPPLPSARVQLLDEWIRTLLWERKLLESTSEKPGLEVLRCKGMFRTDKNEKFVLQGVREIYELSELEGSGEADGVGDMGKLVFIGKGLDEAVRQSLENIVNVL